MKKRKTWLEKKPDMKRRKKTYGKKKLVETKNGEKKKNWLNKRQKLSEKEEKLVNK